MLAPKSFDKNAALTNEQNVDLAGAPMPGRFRRIAS